MSVPFLPHPLIIPTFDFIQMPTNVDNSDKVKLEKLKKYFQKNMVNSNPWQFLEAISHTIGNSYSFSSLTSSDTEYSDNESDETPDENKCIVTDTWIFMPCRHAGCCTVCSQRIQDLSQFFLYVARIFRTCSKYSFINIQSNCCVLQYNKPFRILLVNQVILCTTT